MTAQTVGPYEIVGRLGAGGMGEVFLGRDPRLQRDVALKRVPAAADARARVLREARAAARLSHPHIAAVYDVLELGDEAIIVMEYVDGESLAARIARGPLAADEIVRIGRQLASAVAAAHAHGVIHRDLKPSNVQLTRDGSAKILDFGVARLTGLNTTAPTVVATATGANPGTPAYMAPEQLAGRGADERTDVFGLGAVLFEMATGVRPYRGRDLLELVEAIAAGEPPAAHTINPDVPRWLGDVIAHAVKRRPEDRFQSAQQLEAALAAGPAGAAATASGVRRRFRSRRAAFGVAAAVLAVAAALAALAVPALRSGGVLRKTQAPIRPVVLAVLPVDNPTGDADAEYFGAGIASIVAENLGSIAGLTLLSRASTGPFQAKRNDLATLRRELGADYVLDLMIKSASPAPQLVARLKATAGNAVVWERTIDGDALGVERSLLSDLAKVLESRALPRRLSSADWARINRLPTTSSSALLQYSQARALLDRHDVAGNIERAIALLKQAVAADPAFALAHAALADAYWEQYQRDKDPALAARATAAVDEALRIDPGQAPVYAALALMYQQTGRYEDAVKALRRAIELQPDSDENHRLLGRVLMSRRQYGQAAAEMQTAIDIRPFWNNYFNLGLVKYFAGDYAAALVAFRRSTELNPDFPNGYQALGTTFHVLGDVPQAIGNYEHAVRLSPDTPTAYNNLGFAYFTAKRYEDALNAWKRALALRPNLALYHRNIADAYRSLGRASDAREEYLQAIGLSERALKVNPREVESLGLIAICEARLGRRADAERHASELLAIAPDDRDALLHSAQVHAVLNQPDAALRDLAASIRHGYSTQMARMDDDLQSLRRLPAFEALVSGRSATDSRR